MYVAFVLDQISHPCVRRRISLSLFSPRLAFACERTSEKVDERVAERVEIVTSAHFVFEIGIRAGEIRVSHSSTLFVKLDVLSGSFVTIQLRHAEIDDEHLVGSFSSTRYEVARFYVSVNNSL